MKLFLLTILVAVASGATFDNRIVGGQDAAEGQFPHQVSLRIKNKHGCGGTIIGRRWVVTAAHCTDKRSAEEFQVFVGTTNLQDPTGQELKVEKIIQHEDFLADPDVVMINDISLLKLTQDVVFNEKVKAINLGTESLGSGVSVTLSGWGLTSYPGSVPNKLQFIDLKTITNDECASSHSNVEIIDSEICTFTKVGEGGCRGDSGGPLISGDKLVGVVSWGKPCAKGLPDVYTRISDFMGWIEQNMV